MTVHPVLSVRLVGAGMLASGSEDGTVKLWSLAALPAEDAGGGGAGGGIKCDLTSAASSTECIATLGHGEKVRGLAISLKAGFVASVGGSSKRMHVWKPHNAP